MKAVLLVLGVLFVAGVPVAAQQKEAPAQPAPSVSQLEASIKRDPANSKLYVALGLAYWDKRDSARALEAFQQAVKVGPRSAEAHNWLGVALADKSDFPGAIAAFKKAIALDPEYGRAYTNLGSVLAKSGESVEAVAVFQKALALEPNSEAAHLNLAMALRETGDLDAALEHLRPVAIANPTNARIQYELGQTLRQKGDLDAAVAAFEKALEIEPELREGYYALGVTLKQQSASLRKPRPRASESGRRRYIRAPRMPSRGANWTPPASNSPRRSVWTRIMRSRTTRWDSCWGSREIFLLPSSTSSVQSRCSRNPRRLTTTSVSPSGTAARRTARCPNFGGASASIPLPEPARPFSEPLCATPVMSRGHEQVCNVRLRCCLRPPPFISISASRISARGRWTRRWDNSKPG